MRFKKGIKILGVQPELNLALFIADKIWAQYNQDLVVTEITGGKHSRASLHYLGFAADLRTRYFTKTEKELIGKELKQALGANYDVVVEATHIHIEFQPK